MCLSTLESRGRRSRILLSIGMFSMALALGPRALNLTFGLPAKLVDFFEGLMMGLSIACNLVSLLIARQRGARSPQP
jgi:ABC-type uncharacterized transport system permease subunit